mgnify:CR=1 FL=1
MRKAGWLMASIVAALPLAPMAQAQPLRVALEFDPAPLDPAQAREHLADLVRIYLEGQRHPLPLFPKTSFGYAQALRKSGNPAQALKTARSQFEDNRNNPGEGSDRNVLRVFARADVIFDAGFAALATRVFDPLLAALDEGAR